MAHQLYTSVELGWTTLLRDSRDREYVVDYLWGEGDAMEGTVNGDLSREYPRCFMLMDRCMALGEWVSTAHTITQLEGGVMRQTLFLLSIAFMFLLSTGCLRSSIPALGPGETVPLPELDISSEKASAAKRDAAGNLDWSLDQCRTAIDLTLPQGGSIAELEKLLKAMCPPVKAPLRNPTVNDMDQQK